MNPSQSRLARIVALLGLVGTSLSTAACTAEPSNDGADSTAAAYTADAMPAEVNRRVQSCFTHEWSNAQLTVSSATDVWGGARKTIPVADQLVDGTAWLVNNLGHLLLRGSEGERVIQNLIVALQDIQRDQNLGDFQEVQVVTCVTSRLISYADLGLKTLLGADAAVENYEGVCRDYANVAVRLLQGVGLDGSFVGGELYGSGGESLGGHAWNEVKLASTQTTYWIEPQDDPTRVPYVFFNPQPGE